jgi:hypothetical protein
VCTVTYISRAIVEVKSIIKFVLYDNGVVEGITQFNISSLKHLFLLV